MSHTHRDERDKIVGPERPAEAEVQVATPVAAPTNAEAERAAKERRDADGISVETAVERRFLGDADGEGGAALPTPTLGDLERRALVQAGARTHRGPPAPRASEVGDEVSWIANLQLAEHAYLDDANPRAAWVADPPVADAPRAADDDVTPWIR